MKYNVSGPIWAKATLARRTTTAEFCSSVVLDHVAVSNLTLILACRGRAEVTFKPSNYQQVYLTLSDTVTKNKTPRQPCWIAGEQNLHEQLSTRAKTSGNSTFSPVFGSSCRTWCFVGPPTYLQRERNKAVSEGGANTWLSWGCGHHTESVMTSSRWGVVSPHSSRMDFPRFCAVDWQATNWTVWGLLPSLPHLIFHFSFVPCGWCHLDITNYNRCSLKKLSS